MGGNCIFALHFLKALRPLEEYIIPFEGMKIGVHSFDYEVNADFFAQFGVAFEEEEEGFTAKVKVDMNREEYMLTFNFQYLATYANACGRCLVPLETDLSGNFKLLVRLGETYAEEDDHLMVIPRTAHEFDLSPYVYELLMLAIPEQLRCETPGAPESPCDTSMLEAVEKYSQLPHEEKDESDPRWAILAGLKQQDK